MITELAPQAEKPFSEKKRARLERWKLLKTMEGHYMILGKVYDHPNMVDGRMITTAKIQAIDAEKRLAETKTHVYKLGREKK